MEPNPLDPWVVELPKDLKAALDRLLSGDVVRLLAERTGSLLDPATSGASGGHEAQPAQAESGEDGQGEDGQGDAWQSDEDDGHEPSGECQSSDRGATWWSGSARSGCS